jgi:hypothetical protein
MKGLLEKFSNWSERRLRASQVRILYQNQAAIEYLMNQLELTAKLGIDSTSEIATSLRFFDDVVANGIVDLTVATCLSDERSGEQLQINSALKNLYAGDQEGRRRARVTFGEASGDLVDFATRFRPAGGWDALSDREWDKMVSKALGR